MKNKLLLLLAMVITLTTQTLMAQVPNYVPTNGLIGYWPFSGNANDQSGNGNNGKVISGLLSNDRLGNAISSYYLNGQTDYITVPSVSSILPNRLTLSVWVKIPSNYTGNNGIGPIIRSRFFGYVLWFDSSNGSIIHILHHNSSATTTTNTPSNINDNQWHQLVGTFDGTNNKLYLDGQLISTDANTTLSNLYYVSDGPIAFGRDGNNPSTATAMYQGWIDDIGIWNRALTSSEIQLLYAGCSTSAPTGSTSQTFCLGSTVANLIATGTNIKWYSTSTGGTALATPTALVNGTTYYASQTVNGCESSTRLTVTVTLNNPTVSASSTTVCSGQPTTLTASSGASTTSNFSVGSIGPSGGYVFYDQGSVINGWRYIETSPTDNGSNSGTGCYCVSIPNTSTAIGTGRTNTTNWVGVGCNGGFINTAITFNINGNTNWFIPSKDELNLMHSTLKLNNLGNFQNVQYWTSSPASYGSCGINGGAWVQNFSNGTQYSDYRPGYQGAGNLRLVRQFATGTPFSTYLWSTGATTSSINVNPTTTTQYWVDINTNGVTCRKFITITVNSTTSEPTGSTTQNLCSGSTVANLTATGTNIKWYSSSAGGTALDSTTALVNGTTYYASQTVNGCESTTRLAVKVSLNATATISLTSGDENIFSSDCYFFEDIVYTLGNGATGVNVYSPFPNWLTTTTDGTKVTISFNSISIPPGNYYFEISTTGGCGSASRTFMRGVDGIMSVELKSPKGSDNQTICMNAPIQDVRYAVTSVFNSGIGLTIPLAFGLPTGVTLRDYLGKEIIFSGTPTEIGVFKYSIYNATGCGGPSFYGGMITVVSTSAPTGANNQNLGQGSTLANLVVVGTNVQWYADSSGGSPLPLGSILINGTTYYASQTVNGCESIERLPVIVELTILGNSKFNSINLIYNPNPVTDFLNIKASIKLKDVKICNVLGQILLQERFNSSDIQLNMSDVPSGTYFVIVEADNRKETFKVLKK